MQCPQCAGQLSYIPGAADFVCTSCTTHQAFPDAAQQPHSPELAELLENPPAGIETQAHACSGCGANTEIPPGAYVASCPFCGNALGSERTPRPHTDPTHLLPFRLDRESALNAIANWNNGRSRIAEWTDRLPRFGRADLENAKMEPVFLPFWMFLPHGNLQRQHDLQIMGIGAPQEKVQLPDQIPHYNGKSFPRQELYVLEPWPLQQTVPFNPVFVSRIAVESPHRNLGEAWQDFLSSVAFYDSYLDHLGGTLDVQSLLDLPVPLRTVKFHIGEMPIWRDILQANNLLATQVLLPAWICNATLAGKNCRIFVNGASGEVVFDMQPFGGPEKASTRTAKQWGTYALGCAAPTIGMILGIILGLLFSRPWLAVASGLLGFLAVPFILWKGKNIGRKVVLGTGESSVMGSAEQARTRQTGLQSGMGLGCSMLIAAPIGLMLGGFIGMFVFHMGNNSAILAFVGAIALPLLAAITLGKFMQSGTGEK